MLTVGGAAPGGSRWNSFDEASIRYHPEDGVL